MRGAAVPGESVFGDAPAQAGQEARQGCGGSGRVNCDLVKRRNIFRCYNHLVLIAVPTAVLTALATLESCFEPRFLGPGNHRRQSSSPRASGRERVAGMADRM